MNHLGYDWNARQWAIFNNLYSDTAYAYVKTAWDAENSEPDRSHRAFQSAVVAFSTPESINPANSTRVDDFYRALQATTTADCTADSAASPNAHVTAVRTALAALEAADRSDIHGNHLYDSLLTAHLADPVLTEVQNRARPVTHTPVPPPPVLSRDGLVVAVATDHALVRASVRDGRRSTVELPHPAGPLALSADGARAVVGGPDSVTLCTPAGNRTLEVHEPVLRRRRRRSGRRDRRHGAPDLAG